jgi:DNA recombination protein RmuC
LRPLSRGATMTDLGLMILSATLGGAVAAIGVWLFCGRRAATLKSENDALRGANAEARQTRNELENAKGRLEAATRDERELAEARERIFNLGRECAVLRTELDQTAKARAEQVAQLTQLRQDVQDQFHLIAGKALQTNAEGFLREAHQVFENQKNVTNAEIDKRTQHIAELLGPLAKSLDAYDGTIKDIERARIAGFATIDESLRAINLQHGEVKTVTANLVNALRAAPKTRGRWAEHTLRRVMELSGMVEHCDFETEKHFRGDDESLRPDAVIHLPGGRTIVVDAKAPISAYLQAVDAVTDEEREACLKRHATQLRERLNNLSSKSYSEKISGSPDCVVMFVPGDNFVSAAFERDHDLFEDGIKSRVLICTPTTFIALAKAISYGWGQEKVASNALAIARLGKELYARLATFGDHISELGRQINNAAKKYNALVGSLESHVMPQARRFSELGVEGTSNPLGRVVEVDTVVRFPQQNRDLLLTKAE